MTSRVFESLTDAQREAVEHTEGPLLILAGPGSGKTRVVTHRIAHLHELGVPAREILALTFTNKAADEMKRRVADLVPGATFWIGTFHRFCSRLLRQYADLVGLSPNFTIYDANDSRRALKHVLEEVELQLTMTSPDRLIHEISWVKNHLITAEEYQAPRGSDIGKIVEEVYPAYQQQLIRANAVDFDDLLLHVARLLQQSPELRASLDQTYRFVMVDEYQDTNLAQYVISRALAIDSPNLAVTGDPDQSIYGWRGANLNNILDFERDYPQVHVVRLEQNYRSTPSILRVADGLIAHNIRRKQKRLFTENSEGPPVRVVKYQTEKEEADDIAAQMADAIRRSEWGPQDFAVFYRTNALSRPFEHALRDHGIPYQIVNGVEFYQRKEIKDALAYLQLINNPRNDIALLRIINVPSRQIGKKTIQRIVEIARSRGVCLLEAARGASSTDFTSKRAAVRVRDFVRLIDRLSQRAEAPLEELIGLVLTETGYLEQLKVSESPEDQERAANLEELLTAAREFDRQYEEPGALEAFLEQASLVNDTDAWDSQSQKVTLMTLHSAKGLEFPNVFIVAVEEKLLPHERSREGEALEEERRLLFVGITRAKQRLQLSYVQRRAYRGGYWGGVASSFLGELPREDLEFATSNGFGVLQTMRGLPESPPATVRTVASPLTTTAMLRPAAELLGSGSDASNEAKTAPVDPDLFRVGMAVIHPKYGPGKVAALSGDGARRTGTINFPTAGQKKFVLSKSPLRPVS